MVVFSVINVVLLCLIVMFEVEWMIVVESELQKMGGIYGLLVVDLDDYFDWVVMLQLIGVFELCCDNLCFDDGMVFLIFFVVVIFGVLLLIGVQLVFGWFFEWDDDCQGVDLFKVIFFYVFWCF